jgi:hypothetical protein
VKERPILFSAPMVRAILDGRKTMTRRVVSPQPEWRDIQGLFASWVFKGGLLYPNAKTDVLTLCPYGQPGDRLWVREAWRVPACLDSMSGRQIADKALDAGYRKPWAPIQYEADGTRNSERDWYEFGSTPGTQVPGRYRHARFMPRWASRITLEITGVRVERLQAISAADAEAEGLRRFPFEDSFAWAWRDGDTTGHASPTGAFRNLWETINGAGSWDDNPWVWVVEFRRITKAYEEATRT